MSVTRRAAFLVALVAASLFGGRALADEKPVYSAYELRSIRDALARLHGTIDPHPEHKAIEGIDVIVLDVIENRDPAPNFLNTFHSTTKDRIIAQEVLQSPGEPYDASLIAETCRNLRNKSQLSLVLCLPLKGSTERAVRVLIITKDVWSLRLNWNVLYADGKLETLVLQPSEININGTHQAVSINTDLEPYTFSIGASYSNPRVFGSWINTSASANIILNRFTGVAEGTFGSLAYGQPLYSTRTEWAWGGSIGWDQQISRRLVGGDLATFDSLLTKANDTIPWIYDVDSLSGVFSVTRSFGIRVKHNFELGVAANRSVYRVPDDPVQFTDPVALADFIKSEVPVSDTAIGPYLEYHTFENRWMSVLNFNTLGLQEDVQLGEEAFIRIEPVTRALKSSRDYIAVGAGVGYTVPLKDGLARVYGQGYLEFAGQEQPAIGSGQTTLIPSMPDEYFTGGLRIETPNTKIGRFVLDSIVVARPHNYLNVKSTLGGDTRLRGYPSDAFIGSNMFATNTEFRTRPLEILTCQMAAAVFFDVGDAFDEWDQVVLKRGAGIGFRGVLPQLNRTVFRIDWGLPLTPGVVPYGFPGNVVVTFGQAFGMPDISP